MELLLNNYEKRLRDYENGFVCIPYINWNKTLQSMIELLKNILYEDKNK